MGKEGNYVEGSWRSKAASLLLRQALFQEGFAPPGEDWGWIRWLTFKPEFLREIIKRSRQTWYYQRNCWDVASNKKQEILNASDWLTLEWLSAGNDERFEIAFDKVAYDSCYAHLYEPFGECWLQNIPKPLYVRATSGHAGKGICDAARGYLLPPNFIGELAHGSMLANVDSIAANGLLAGGIVGDRANNHFSACDWRGKPAAVFNRSALFTGPEEFPHKPREKCDAIYLFNYDLICEFGLEPRMNRKRSVTTKSGENVPPSA